MFVLICLVAIIIRTSLASIIVRVELRSNTKVCRQPHEVHADNRGSFEIVKPQDWTEKTGFDLEIGSNNRYHCLNPEFGLWKGTRGLKGIIMVMLLAAYCCILWLGYLPTALSLGGGLRVPRRQSQLSNSTGVLDVFQVYQPVPFGANGSSNSCSEELLLMEHVFGNSYGKPFVGHYEPPECDFDTVRINLTVTSKGRQFDRLALMYLGDTEVFRTSTAEPTANGIVWTYIKEMSQYNSLWKQPQKLIFDLGNIVNNIYTGPFSVTLTAYFSYEGNVQTADLILPISARNSASNSPSFFQLPSGNATVLYKIPATASRAIVSISACGQAEEEFWWSNVFSSDTETFKGTVGELYGFSPFREVQLYIDGILAGVVWPFPIIFTGGVAPGFWRPIVGIDAFDLRQPEIDVSPFLPLLTDGQDHSFEIKVVGLEVAVNGTATLSSSVGSYWVVTGNIFLYLDEDTSYSAADRSIPKVVAPVPKLITTRNLVQSQTGANESLSYSVVAERTLSVTSSHFSWSQALSCSNFGLLNQKGFSQENEQKTSGKASAVPIGANANPSHVGFVYPLYVNTTYGDTDTGMTIDATMKRGLDIVATGPTGISTYTLTSGPLSLHTKQSGKAHYESITGGSSTSSGDTTDDFESSTGGISYHRHVRAINGNVVLDTDSGSRSSSPVIYQEPGRNSVRSILGRGPSGPLGSY